MHLDVCKKGLDRVLDGAGGDFLRFREFFAGGDEFADEFVPFPALGFGRLAWRVAGHLASSLFTLPPFNEVVAGAFVPHVSTLDPVERDEFPEAAGLADFFDDANSLGGWHWQSLGVYFLNFTDTKRLAGLGTDCK